VPLINKRKSFEHQISGEHLEATSVLTKRSKNKKCFIIIIWSIEFGQESKTGHFRIFYYFYNAQMSIINLISVLADNRRKRWVHRYIT